MGSNINLRVPVDEGEEITAQAHSLARDATMENKESDPPSWSKVQLRVSVLRWTFEHRKDIFPRSTTGRFTSWIQHPQDLKRRSQLRTGHAKLNGHLHRIGQSDSNICACDIERETHRTSCYLARDGVNSVAPLLRQLVPT
ncbi:uncharacterized protein N7479_003102 [Penicillium vulpinum]|uniref:uncharacterized protein n=1 Tax=Penicillium vulpinum TaxID=29845 RepID=UPI0025493D87|nr:uncharacterized protein N7479_003102 [Penicillium vulpinum]KAJ5963226.1 hypothetical protein N7479_003102 [Penicillium vulpinum]